MTSLLLPVRAAPLPALVPGVCQVWWARQEDVGPRHDALLAPADLRRRSRLRQAADRHRLTVAAVLVRVVVGAHAGVPPADLWIDRTCPGCGGQHGKPRLAALPDVHFSVSHSAGNVAVAVGLDGPVGVDVEETVPFDPAELEGLAACTLAPEERAALARLPAAGRPGAFTAYWTRKEALVKATGDGLGALLDHIVVSPPSSPPRLLRWDGRDESVSLHALHPPEGAVGVLAVLGDSPVQVLEHAAGPLLRAALLQGPAASL
jgi:4'-phosphopantetheinyl transferase